MHERRATQLAVICLIIAAAPFAVLAWEYLNTRDMVLEQQRRAQIEQTAPQAPAAKPGKQKTIYVPPEPIRFPLY